MLPSLRICVALLLGLMCAACASYERELLMPADARVVLVLIGGVSRQIVELSPNATEDTLDVLRPSAYTWARQSFRWYIGDKMVLLQDDYIAEQLTRAGISPIITRDPATGAITHLSVYPTDMPALVDVSRAAGATHVVRLRVLESVLNAQQTSKRSWGPVTLTGNFTDVTRRVVIEATSFPTDTTVPSKTQRYEAVSEPAWSHLLEDIDARAAIAAAIISDLGTSMQKMPSTGEKVRDVDRVAAIPAGNVYGPRYEGGQLRLDRVSAIGGEFLRFDFSFWNKLVDDVVLKLTDPAEVLVRDSFGLVYRGVSYDPGASSIIVRAGERKEFGLLTNAPPSYVRTVAIDVSMMSTVSTERYPLRFKFLEVQLP